MKPVNYVHWIGATAAITFVIILAFNAENFLRERAGHAEIIPYLLFALLPSFLTVFLTVFRHFWSSLAFGLWLAFLSWRIVLDTGGSPSSMFLLLAALTICTTPFLDQACRTTNINAVEDAQQQNPSDRS